MGALLPQIFGTHLNDLGKQITYNILFESPLMTLQELLQGVQKEVQSQLRVCQIKLEIFSDALRAFVLLYECHTGISVLAPDNLCV